MNELTKCPKCGGESGYYRKERGIAKYNRAYFWDGEVADNSCSYDHFDITFISKSIYCIDCNEKVFLLT